VFWLGQASSSKIIYSKPHAYLEKIDFPLLGDRIDASVLINRNKVSMVKGELYTLRRQLIFGLDNLHVYGPGWTEPNRNRIFVAFKQSIMALASPGKTTFGARRLFVIPKNYLGQALDKHQTLTKYRIALAIENSQEILTKKLLDAWMAGSIPVYVGPSLGDFGIPDGLAIECGASVEEVKEGIHQAPNLDHEAFLSKLKDWLFDELTFSQWGWEPSWRRIFDIDVSLPSGERTV
jgi:hypothetical protein